MNRNKFIARFMNAQFDDMGNCFVNPEGAPYNIKGLKHTHMSYNSSWDWLMPVIDRIEESGEHEVDIFGRCVDISNVLDNSYEPHIETLGEDKLDAAYSAVINFIKWYNEISEETK